MKATAAPSSSTTTGWGPAGVELKSGCTSSVTVQLVPVGMLATLAEPESVMVRVWSNSVPSQSTTKVKVPVPPSVVLLMTRLARWRTLVKTIVCCPPLVIVAFTWAGDAS